MVYKPPSLAVFFCLNVGDSFAKIEPFLCSRFFLGFCRGGLAADWKSNEYLGVSYSLEGDFNVDGEDMADGFGCWLLFCGGGCPTDPRRPTDAFWCIFFVLGVNAGFGGQDLGRKANEL